MANLICVAFHAMMTTFIAAAIIPVYEDIAKDLHCSIQKASYLTSLQIAILGWGPLFWKPISNRFGRRPVWFISTVGSLLFNVGCALSRTYTSMAICRAFTSFFICPAIAIGSGVVTETFFKKERAKYIGVWTLLVTLGPPSGPFFMGFVGYQTGDYRWIYWILAMVCLSHSRACHSTILIRVIRSTVDNSSPTFSLARRRAIFEKEFLIRDRLSNESISALNVSILIRSSRWNSSIRFRYSVSLPSGSPLSLIRSCLGLPVYC